MRQTGICDPLNVTYHWRDHRGEQQSSRVFGPSDGKPETWAIETGTNVETRWVEFEPAAE